MLEQPKKSGGKLVSHILASHGGDYKIHFMLLRAFIITTEALMRTFSFFIQTTVNSVSSAQ